MRCFTGGPGPDQVPDGNKVFLVGHKDTRAVTEPMTTGAHARCRRTRGFHV
jgi:hypothetical protein